MRIVPSPARRAAAALAAACCGLVLAQAAGASPLAPGIDRKYVCDWSFVSGPRAGQRGMESRRWLGTVPTLQGSTWWPGATATSAYSFTSPRGVSANPPTTRWNVSTQVNGVSVSGQVDVSTLRFPRVETRLLELHDFSNGASVTCLELGPAALAWIHSTYQGGDDQPNVCRCATGYHYDATVRCIERCVAYWDDHERWARLAPPCLRDPDVVGKAACLLFRNPAAGGAQDPNDPWDPSICDLFENDPTCSSGGGDGAPCGSNGRFCNPGCNCTAQNVCRCPLPTGG